MIIFELSFNLEGQENRNFRKVQEDFEQKMLSLGLQGIVQEMVRFVEKFYI